MIRTVDLRGRALSKAQYNLELPRATLNVAEAMVLIQPILDRVKNGTEADLIALAQEFDGVTPASIRVPQKELDKALSGVQSAIALVDSIDQGLDVVNAYAAEHLEIQTRNSRSDAAKIRNAGAVFIGRFSPVSLGDYSAGSNHVLPTGGCACHSSGLSVQTFLRGLHFIEYGQKAFTDIVNTVVTLANAEDLPAHGEAMTVRLENL